MKKTMKYPGLLIPLLSLLTAFTAAPARANIDDKTPWYEVSLVIFKNKNAPTGNEQWLPPSELEVALPENAIDLDQLQNGADKTQFKPVEPTDKEFKEVLHSLRLSSGYEVMTSKTWIQPALDTKKAMPVLIHAGQEYEGLFELTGSVTLVVSRYLHLQTDLWLSEYTQKVQVIDDWWNSDAPANNTFNTTSNDTNMTMPPGAAVAPSPDGNGTQQEEAFEAVKFNEPSPLSNDRFEATQTVELKQSRRMRSGELHYLDNPLFGVVVKVTRYKPGNFDSGKDSEQ